MSDELAFRRLLDDAGADDAVRRRAGRGARRSLCGTDATMPGLLVEFARVRRSVLVDVNGHPMVGSISAVTTTSVTLDAARSVHVVRLDAVTAIRTLDLDTAESAIDATDEVPEGSSWATVVRSTLEPGTTASILMRGSIELGTVVAVSDAIVQLRAGTSRVAFAISSVDALSMSVPGSI